MADIAPLLNYSHAPPLTCLIWIVANCFPRFFLCLSLTLELSNVSRACPSINIFNRSFCWTLIRHSRISPARNPISFRVFLLLQTFFYCYHSIDTVSSDTVNVRCVLSIDFQFYDYLLCSELVFCLCLVICWMFVMDSSQTCIFDVYVCLFSVFRFPWCNVVRACENWLLLLQTVPSSWFLDAYTCVSSDYIDFIAARWSGRSFVFDRSKCESESESEREQEHERDHERERENLQNAIVQN